DKESKYYRLIYGIDQAVGMITKQLEQLGIADNTVIIFTSDNGWSGGRKGLSGKVLPYEDASRAPMIIYDPRHKTANKKTRINELTANIDIAPTVLDLAGIEKPNYMQGESMMKLLEDPEKSIHESLLLINVWGVPSHQSISVVNKKYKYINWFYGGQNYQQTQEVYDMNKDPLERKNQIDNHELKDDIEKMGILYDNWLTRWKNEAVHREDYLRYPNLGDRELNWSQKNKKHTSLLEEMQLKMTDENGVYSKHKKKANNMDDKSKIQ
ncbi:MAG: sulfatase-like hydrolase/transferase, partial [Bacteroidetes bacterium]|nr:sulfatase-like hydrolase/transferase [Bacteroidota bacterium]